MRFQASCASAGRSNPSPIAVRGPSAAAASAISRACPMLAGLEHNVVRRRLHPGAGRTRRCSNQPPTPDRRRRLTPRAQSDAVRHRWPCRPDATLAPRRWPPLPAGGDDARTPVLVRPSADVEVRTCRSTTPRPAPNGGRGWRRTARPGSEECGCAHGGRLGSTCLPVPRSGGGSDLLRVDRRHGQRARR